MMISEVIEVEWFVEIRAIFNPIQDGEGSKKSPPPIPTIFSL